MPEEWRVEDVNCDDDGGCAVAIFSGPFDEERAKRYARSAQDEYRLAVSRRLPELPDGLPAI